ncbi:MAG: murein biosynthesis integral membrane protein MurJ [Bacteriovoracaceae bacterium]
MSDSTKKAVLLSSIKMAIATFLSRVFGLVREQVLAAYFGASGLTDAFQVAFRIPNLLRDLFAEGAFSSAFVPTFTEAKNNNHEEARELLWSLFFLLSIITGLIGLFTFLFAPTIVSQFAPNYVSNPHKFEVTVVLTKIMSPFLLCVSLAALFMGALNSLKVFFVPSLAPTFFNIASILSMIGFPAYLGAHGYEPVYALGIGVMIGGVAQAAVMIPLLYKHNYKPLWPKKILTVKSKKVFIALGPGLIGFAASQVNLLVNTILATSTVEGAVSWLTFAFRLFQFPVGILSVSIGNSNLVHFSEQWKQGQKEEAKNFLKTSYDTSYFVIIPCMVLLFGFAQEYVNLIFERGRFDPNDSLMTATALELYAIGLPFYGVYKIFVPTFYALDRQRVPVYTSIISILINIGFCLLLVPRYGFKILALGTTLSMFLNSTFQSFIIKKELDLSLSFFVGKRMLKILSAGLLSYLVLIYVASRYPVIHLPLMSKLFLLSLESGLVIFTYVFALIFMGEGSFMEPLLRRFKKKS